MADNPSGPAADPVVPQSPNGEAAPNKVTEEGVKVFAGNLAYSTTDEGLRAFFAPVQGDILSAQVIHRGTRSAGYGFVALTTEDAAKKAVDALHQQQLDGRSVIIEIAKPPEEKVRKPRTPKKRINRRGSKAVPGEVTEDEANEPAAPKASTDDAAANGEVKSKKKKKKPARKPRAEGEEVETTEAAQRKSRQPRPKRPAGEDPVGEPSKTMVFVANLGFNVDDAGLAELFTTNGLNVVSARVVKKRWGKPRKSKGYGFVDVGSEEEQKKAVAVLEGKEIEGRQIAVKIAVNAAHDEDREVTPETTVLAT